jgi:Sigma-70 region 2
VQETLLRAIGNINSFQPGTNMCAWLFTILRNLFRSEYSVSRGATPSGSSLRHRWREVRNRMHATICKRGFDNSRNTFTQQQFSLARHCQQAQPLLRKLPYALVSPRELIRELRPHAGHIEEMRP